MHAHLTGLRNGVCQASPSSAVSSHEHQQFEISTITSHLITTVQIPTPLFTFFFDFSMNELARIMTRRINMKHKMLSHMRRLNMIRCSEHVSSFLQPMVNTSIKISMHTFKIHIEKNHRYFTLNTYPTTPPNEIASFIPAASRKTYQEMTRGRSKDCSRQWKI